MRRGLDVPPELIKSLPHCDARMGPRAAIGLAILFCGGPKVTTGAWQKEAHPRYGSDPRGGVLVSKRPARGAVPGLDTVKKGKAAGRAGISP